MAKDIETWGVFFSVFGIIFAIIAGLILVEGLRGYGSLSGITELELN